MAEFPLPMAEQVEQPPSPSQIRPENTCHEIECNVEHHEKKKKQSADREYPNIKSRPSSDGVYGYRKDKLTVHEVPAVITGDRLWAFFSKYAQVEDVSTVIS